MNTLKIKKSIIIPNLLLVGVIIIYVLTFFNNLTSLSVNVYLTFLINFIVVVAGILHCKLPISLNKINWYFFLIFLIIIPFYQLTSGYAPRNMFLTEYEIIFTNLLILLWCVGYFLSYNLKNSDVPLKTKKALAVPKSKPFYTFLLIASILCFIQAIAATGFSNLFIRGEVDLDEGTFGILIFFLTRSTPALSLSIFLWTLKKKIHIFPNYQMYAYSAVLLFITIILNNPLTMSRFLIGAVYLGLIISAFKMSLFKGKRFDVLLIFSLVIIFPIMHALKFYTIEQILSPSVSLEINNYNSVDFDAYQMIGRTIRFAERYSYQFGSQLRSVLLFFMPRDIWDVKGDPSGQLVATIQNVSYTNLSSPIVAEGFIDFGVIGVFAYSFIFGKIAKLIDFKKYRLEKSTHSIYFNEILFSFLIGFSVYIYRGALQPTFLRLMGFFLFLIIMFVITKLMFSKNRDYKKRI